MKWLDRIGAAETDVIQAAKVWRAAHRDPAANIADVVAAKNTLLSALDALETAETAVAS